MAEENPDTVLLGGGDAEGDVSSSLLSQLQDAVNGDNNDELPIQQEDVLEVEGVIPAENDRDVPVNTPGMDDEDTENETFGSVNSPRTPARDDLHNNPRYFALDRTRRKGESTDAMRARIAQQKESALRAGRLISSTPSPPPPPIREPKKYQFARRIGTNDLNTALANSRRKGGKTLPTAGKTIPPPPSKPKSKRTPARKKPRTPATKKPRRGAKLPAQPKPPTTKRRYKPGSKQNVVVIW